MSAVSDVLASDASSETTDDDSYDFYANETSDFYLAFWDTKDFAGAVIDVESSLERPDVNPWSLTREDIPDLREQAEEEGWAATEALWAIYAAVKSEMGSRQADENDFGIGLAKDDDGGITGFRDGGYAAAFGATLPTIEREQVNDADLNALGRRMDTTEVGFHPGEEPQTLVFPEGVLPVAAADYETVDQAIEMLANIPDEPSLGNPERPDEASNPTIVTVQQVEEDVTDIASEEALEWMLAAEQNNNSYEGGRKGALEAIEDRLATLRGNEEPEETEEGGLSRYAKAEQGGGDASSSSDANDDPEEMTEAERIKAFNNLCEAGHSPEEAAEKAGL